MVLTANDLISGLDYNKSWELVKTVFNKYPEMELDKYHAMYCDLYKKKKHEELIAKNCVHIAHVGGNVKYVGFYGQALMHLAFKDLISYDTRKKGFDYRDGTDKVDLKTSTKSVDPLKCNSFRFTIKNNKIPDRFDLLYLDKEQNFKPIKLLKVPARLVNDVGAVNVRLNPSPSDRWYHLNAYSVDVAPLVEAWKGYPMAAYMENT